MTIKPPIIIKPPVIIEISAHDLTDAAIRYHHNMVDQDQFTVSQVQSALETYIRVTAAYFIENVTEFEYDRPDMLQACLDQVNPGKEPIRLGPIVALTRFSQASLNLQESLISQESPNPQ